MKMAGGMRVGAGTQSLAQFLGALWDFGKAIQQRAQIQSCPHGEDRQTFPPPQILEDRQCPFPVTAGCGGGNVRSEEHTSELQSRGHLVCRLLLEKKKIIKK